MKNNVLFIIISISFFSISLSSYAQHGMRHETIHLTGDELKAFKKQAEQKIHELQNFISIIGNKSEANGIKDIAIRSAVDLFIKDAVIEVSYLKSGVEKINNYWIKKYLKRLRQLRYTKVEIKWYELAHVSQLTRGDDGRYYATATVYQEFTGIKDGVIIYRDKTQKTVEIVLDNQYDPHFKTYNWVIKLGDIRVKSTTN